MHYRLLRGCCGSDISGSANGKDALHVYEVQYDGLEKPVILFLNRYDEDAPKAPAGFGFAREKI